jgi:plastocyanin
MRVLVRVIWAAGVLFLCGLAPAGFTATVRVDVGDDFFRPATTNIAVNDTVEWVWIGIDVHTSTSSDGLWDSGVHGTPFTFSHQFTAAGNFPYFCRLHLFMTGSIVAGSANTPPSVTITNPANGAVFAAPASFSIEASASDPGGSVTQVEFFRGTTSVGVDTASPYTAAVAALSAGGYTLSAVATDNGGAKATNEISVSVVTPVAVRLSSAERLSASQFRFSYSANAGLRYAVERSGDLTSWTSISTNMAASSTETFVDNAATQSQNFYRVRRLGNP